jgi:ubiquinone/menaquinone biosynthesis C-methylase UbiE
VPIPVTEDRLEISDHEVARIRDAYARRRQGHPNAYSFLNPSHVLQIQERDSELLFMLSRHGVDRLDTKTFLEIGCGTGYWLRAFLQWGTLPENAFGIDLLQERIEQAQKLCPRGVSLQCGSAASLDLPDASFDIVLQSTVFSSILDPQMKRRVAAEMLRVLKPGGFALWYDFFLDNPRNADVRGIRKREIGRLFPDCQIHIRRTTLAPPIARLVGRYSPLLYTLLSRTKILCAHYLSLIRKN